MKKSVFFFMVFFVVHYGISQETFFVYKVKGEPFMKINDSVKSVGKGSELNEKTTVSINENDVLYFINNQGDIFVLNHPGKFSYSDLQKTPAIKDNTSFSKKFFGYVWKEFTNKTASRNDKVGVVYRGDDNILMRTPNDSIQIYSSEINFEWDSIKGKTKEYYLVLRDLDTDKITKIGTHSTSISLFVDDFILREGGNYQWCITETKYPNYKKIVFYNFKLLNQSEFESLDDEIKNISEVLKEIGLSEIEIRETICQDFKICY